MRSKPMQAPTLVLAAGCVLASLPALAAEPADRAVLEAAGLLDSGRPAAPPARRTAERPRGGGVDVLLIPDSTGDRVMAFDPTTGNLVNADFIASDPTHLSTPKNALPHSDNASILVVDQVNDVVQRYTGNGGYIGVFAPPGGPNTAVMDNATGAAYRPSGNLVVCVQSGTNANSVAEFDSGGAYVGNFIANGSGGLAGPFDVLFRASDVLVSSINTDQVLRYDRTTGAFLGVFTAINNFPEQIAQASNGNVLVANFSGTEEGVVEYTSAGAFVGRYDPAGLTGYRGVYELPNGNILTSTSNGVHEISRAGVLVQTKISVTGAQYVERAQGLTPVELQGFSVE